VSSQIHTPAILSLGIEDRRLSRHCSQSGHGGVGKNVSLVKKQMPVMLPMAVEISFFQKSKYIITQFELVLTV
jgi:hypothetical protein